MDYADPNQPASALPPVTSDAENFYSGAIRRISNFMVGIGIVFSAAAWFRFGWRPALGFACGCALAYLNFHWLKKVVGALADRMGEGEKPKSGKGVVIRFLL